MEPTLEGRPNIIQSRPESSRVVQSRPESSNVGKSRPVSARVVQSHPEFKVVRSQSRQRRPESESSRVVQSRPESSRIVQSRLELPRVIQSRPESSGVVQSRPESPRVVRSRPESSGVGVCSTGRLRKTPIPATGRTIGSDFAVVGIGLTIAGVESESWVRSKEHITALILSFYNITSFRKAHTRTYRLNTKAYLHSECTRRDYRFIQLSLSTHTYYSQH